jgi:hypothetical protein
VSISGLGSVLMIVSDRDEAEDIANEMRRDHYDMGTIDVTADITPGMLDDATAIKMRAR